MPTTILGGLIAQVESGGNLPDGPWTNPTSGNSYVNGLFQQFPGFANQYGSGEAGVTNYANQVLAANPNATLGDLYGGYFGGTGSPAAASTSLFGNWGAAGAQASNNWTNVLSANGYNQNTPLASVMGGSAGASNVGDPYSNITTGDADGADLGNDPLGSSVTIDQTATGSAGSADFADVPDNLFDGSTDTAASTTTGALTNSGAIAGAGGQPVNITDLPGLDTSVNSGAKTVSTGVTGAASNLANTAASAFSSIEKYTSSIFVVVAIAVMGIVFVAFGLGLFGKRAQVA